MIFHPTPLAGAYVIELEERADPRGFFARTFCAREFEEMGLKPTVAQANVSYNHLKGTLRGMHYQVPPAAETKLVRCTRGAIHDVIIDLRPESPSYLQHFGVDLTEEEHFDIVRRKTAFLFAGSARIGGMLGPITRSSCDSIEAGMAPARSTIARSRASWLIDSKSPVPSRS